MDAKDLYDLILSTSPSVTEGAICDLHKPCSKHRECSIKLSNKYIDFDAVETEFDRGRVSRPSVDAVKNAGHYFCFIEIKGWKKYLEWNTPSEKGIQEQAEYDLKGKLETSEEICVAISGQHNIFRQIPEVFILVTDIDVSEQGVENFHFNMMALATTSSVWESKCNTELNSQLEQQITTIPKYYVTCKQLENKLNVISRV